MYPPNPEFSRIAVVLGVDRKKLFLKKCTAEGKSLTLVLKQLVDMYIDGAKNKSPLFNTPEDDKFNLD